MTQSQFKEILLNLCYTNEEPPVLLDRFWEVLLIDCSMELQQCEAVHPKLDQCH